LRHEQNIPYSVIEQAIVYGSSERLVRSFSRRLGYLSGSKEAQAIVRKWLSPDGLLSDVLGLNELGRAMFQNVAPVLPEATLSALEAVFANADKDTLLRGGHFLRLLYLLAYDAALFERAIKLIRKFAEVLDKDNFEGEASKAVSSLFHIVASGTQAPLAMRLKVLDAFLKSAKPVEQHLGVKALEAAMKTQDLMPFSSLEFGARSRDLGYHPKTGAEVGQWFESVLNLAEPFALKEGPVAARVQKTIARKFRGLWSHGGRYHALERIAKGIAGTNFWRDGWIAVRQTRQYDGNALKGEALTRLTALEKVLRPKDLANSVRGMVLGERGGTLDFEEFDDDEEEEVSATERLRRATVAIEELGKSIAADEDTFSRILPELISGSGRIREFGFGLAQGADEPRALWSRLVAQVANTERPNVDVLLGFLDGLQSKEPTVTHQLLDEAIEHPTLGEWLPYLQASVTIDQPGVDRLRKALELGTAPVDRFIVLVYGGVCEPISGPAFRDLMLAISGKPDGNRIALEILSMRLHSDSTAKRQPLPETVEAGRILLGRHEFVRRANAADHDDYKLGVVASKCLVGPEGPPIARKLWRSMKATVDTYDAYGWEQDDLLKGLFKTQPVAMLDELVAGNDKDRRKSIEIVHETMQHGRHPLSVLGDDVLLGWCDQDSQARYPFAADIALLFTRPNDQTPHAWQPIAAQLLERAPNPAAVFKPMSSRLWPTSYSGSPASKFESRLQLLDELKIGDDAALRQAFDEFRAELVERIAKERGQELEEDRAASGRFE
jgi:hypothetical protein